MGLAIGMAELLSMLKAELNNRPDERKPSNNSQYTVKQALLSAFCVFFTQSPSFLEHQRLMKTKKGRDKAQSLFGLESLPCDNQIRNLLDPVPARNIFLQKRFPVPIVVIVPTKMAVLLITMPLLFPLW
jgi:hypothetical protein